MIITRNPIRIRFKGTKNDAAMHKFGECDLKQLMVPQPGLPDKGKHSYTVKNEGF